MGIVKGVVGEVKGVGWIGLDLKMENVGVR